MGCWALDNYQNIISARKTGIKIRIKRAMHGLFLTATNKVNDTDGLDIQEEYLNFINQRPFVLKHHSVTRIDSKRRHQAN